MFVSGLCLAGFLAGNFGRLNADGASACAPLEPKLPVGMLVIRKKSSFESHAPKQPRLAKRALHVSRPWTRHNGDMMPY
jgi:hypothetical protein